VDYRATFTPVIKPTSVRLITALANKHDWEIDMFDAKRAFLWGISKEEIYMRQPKGFEEGDWHEVVWLMLRVIYCLKQSALEWYEQVRTVMADLGFIRSESNHALFHFDELDKAVTKVHTRCIIGWHVDDGMAASNSRPFLQWVKKRIVEHFGIKDLGPVTKYLRVQFEWERSAHRIWMHQSEYISFLLQEYSLTDCNPVHLPADPKAPLGDPADSYPETPDLRHAYLKLVGELIYLAVNTRPNISYIINALAQHNAHPELHHLAAAKRVLRYLAGTINLRMYYEHNGTDEGLHAYVDASWANEAGRQSVTGYTWYYAGCLISHVSKKQATVVLSSTEAKYMITTHVIQEGLWFRSLLTELSVPFSIPVPVYLDNLGVITLSSAVKFHQHSKHINIYYHFIREHVDNATFSLVWQPSHRNIADILTKALAKPAFEGFRRALRLVAQ
jgi:hypothetical protein